MSLTEYGISLSESGNLDQDFLVVKRDVGAHTWIIAEDALSSWHSDVGAIFTIQKTAKKGGCWWVSKAKS